MPATFRPPPSQENSTMKPHLTELMLFGSQYSLQTITKLLLLSTLILMFLAMTPFLNSPFFHQFQYTSPASNNDLKAKNWSSFGLEKECDISRGEWIGDELAPYYTNKTCWMIQEHQNCIKYGRPDMDFLKWRWEPEGCNLKPFDPARFLGVMRGKSLAFVGDSLARNQMQSLMCLLSQVEYPKDISNTADENFKRMFYVSYNFTITIFWSPFLVKAIEPSPPAALWKLYLDEVDEGWSSQMDEFNYVIISGGNWFSRPSMFYENGHLTGCHYCQRSNVTDLAMHYSNRIAFRTALRAINRLSSFKGMTILRTLSPSHFENGEWNKGGDCVRTRPFRRNEVRLEGTDFKLYNAQVEEFRDAEEEGKKKGRRFRLLDTTMAMLLRPDGHPSRYGHWATENVTLRKDCVHWCLPGPIDVWNDFLLHLIIEE